MNTNKTKIMSLISNNLVLILFSVICIAEVILAKQTAAYLVGEIVTRLFRNSILILSLLIPVWAGMGLNFSIVLGAMAAEIGLIFAKNFFITGVLGIFVSFGISIPLAILFGYLTGRLFNLTKGQEMITGMILGFFAKGLFDLVFMFLCGPVIPIKNKTLLLTNGIGLTTPISLDVSSKSAINNIWLMPLNEFILIAIILVDIYLLVRIILAKKKVLGKFEWQKQGLFFFSLAVTVLYFLFLAFSRKFFMVLNFTDIPVVTGLIILAVCLYITYFSKTKIGSDINAVGQNRYVAASMGINVDKIRIKAVVISTVLAALGQIIFIQEIGNFATYNAHENVGTFAIAALLVGGASINKATIRQAFLGALLFHTMFIISPIAGMKLFGNAQMGEYFRVFACYAVITIALVMHSVSNKKAS
ncbi:ABC transporter permease [uncultured Sphaerochaeta sp.]|uniref:ABC transporter permease subunit n=1 Tax=uncultured Sphaerochaeta sp. TaxID=886478 RepID=UPI002A0A84A1|nr:ABC transporter permease [uncultured Sphaerochaeta sp.]